MTLSIEKQQCYLINFKNSYTIHVLQILNTSCLTNSADPDQTASSEAVWSGSSLFAIQASILWLLDMINNILYANRKVFIVQNF